MSFDAYLEDFEKGNPAGISRVEVSVVDVPET